MQGSFFIFDVFIFWGVRGVKGQKIAKDDKKILSVELHISGTIYHMILINGHMCKRIISPGVFFYTFFPNFNFWGQQWRKRAKDDLKWQKIMYMQALHIIVSIYHMIVFFVPQL